MPKQAPKKRRNTKLPEPIYAPDGAVLYTTAEAATFLRTTTRVLNRWRGGGKGPRYVKAGKRVTYRREDLDAWILSQVRSHTRETRPLRRGELTEPQADTA